MSEDSKISATPTPKPGDVLLTPMQPNDAGAPNVGTYLIRLLKLVWEHEAIKRPFGNSGWQYEVYQALVKAGYLDGEIDTDGYLEWCDTKEGEFIVLQAIEHMLNFKPNR